MGAYNSKGAEGLSGDAAAYRARDEGLLFWLGWVSHNTVSLFNTADASGPFRRAIIMASCTTYQQIVLDSELLEPVIKDALGITDLLADTKLCPPS